jgi:hypothetical protein
MIILVHCSVMESHRHILAMAGTMYRMIDSAHTNPQTSSYWDVYETGLSQSAGWLEHTQLAKRLQQGTIVFTSSSVHACYIKLHMNLTFSTVYCGLMRHHSHGVEYTVITNYMNGHWNILILNAIHFDKDLASMFGARIKDNQLNEPYMTVNHLGGIQYADYL